MGRLVQYFISTSLLSLVDTIDEAVATAKPFVTIVPNISPKTPFNHAFLHNRQHGHQAQ